MKLQGDQAGKISFTPGDLAGLGLGYAFRKAVIEDSEFEMLRNAASAADPFFDFVYLHQHDHFWPVCPSQTFKVLNANNSGRFRDMPQVKPVLVATARLDALCMAFGDFLRNQQLTAVGRQVAHVNNAPPSLHPLDTISHGIWAQERFCFHDLTGDICERVIPARKSPTRRVQRWTGVVIHWPQVVAEPVITTPDDLRNRGDRPARFNWRLGGR
jgi:hypothetical protein